MHIGNYLKEIVKKQRYSTTAIGELVNKTDQAVRKDFEKKSLHMSVLDAYARALNVNIYEIMGYSWDHPEESLENIVKDSEDKAEYKINKKQESKKARGHVDQCMVTLEISGTKKDQILKILLEK